MQREISLTSYDARPVAQAWAALGDEVDRIDKDMISTSRAREYDERLTDDAREGASL